MLEAGLKHCAVEDGLELLILLPLPLEWQDWHAFSVVLGAEPKASPRPGKPSRLSTQLSLFYNEESVRVHVLPKSQTPDSQYVN